ncbi:Sigma-adaptin 3A [Orbilia brochopaga]|uniref:Sigma-adaptin 3A n=1 Tax=Orbilia brochopaga TaxID=3140254 RepID=A0AAV9VEY4_9PEZI
MINAVLVFNNTGQPRLTKFYSQIDVALQQRLISEIFTLVANRPPSACNFLPLPPLLQKTSSEALSDTDQPTRIIYRHYATLYFIIIADDLESELGLLDLIQVFVECLDRIFENVCELDLIFNFETLHQVLAEMIQGGGVVEVDRATIVDSVKRAAKVTKRPQATLPDVTRSGSPSSGRSTPVHMSHRGSGVTGIGSNDFVWSGR